MIYDRNLHGYSIIQNDYYEFICISAIVFIGFTHFFMHSYSINSSMIILIKGQMQTQTIQVRF